MKKLLSITLATLMLTTATLTACSKASEGDWHDEVSSVMDEVQSNAITVTTKLPNNSQLPNTSETPAQPTNRIPYPLENPDAGLIPSISYGRNYILYKDYVYFPAGYLGESSDVLSYSKLTDLVLADQSGIEEQPVPQRIPLCTDPFCNHRAYSRNNGIYCPLYFGVERGDANGGNLNYSQSFYCLDYAESGGNLPVFYICAAEPEYTVIGEQVIETESKDAAIYRYDSATGKRTMLVDNLSDTIYFFAVSGDYIYYGSPEGLTVLNKSGKQLGRIESSVRLYHILSVEKDTLYLCDDLGNLYTTDRLLKDQNQVFCYDFDTSNVTADYLANVCLGDFHYVPPYGYTISDGYLYFCADFVKEYEDQYKTIYSTSIYRLPLTDLTDNPEFVVNKVSLTAILGGDGGLVYYIPYNEQVDSPNMNLNSINVDTKEIKTVISNGFDTVLSNLHWETIPVITQRFIIGRSTKYTQGAILIVDLQTGDIMYMQDDQYFG